MSTRHCVTDWSPRHAPDMPHTSRSGVQQLRFEFKQFSCPTGVLSWTRTACENKRWQMKLVCEPLTIDLGDDSDDEGLLAEFSHQVTRADLLGRKLSVQLLNRGDTPVWATALVTTESRDQGEHAVTLSLRLYEPPAPVEAGQVSSTATANSFLSLEEALRLRNLDGSFVLHVVLQARASHGYSPCTRCKLVGTMLELFGDGDGEDADFIFEVGEEHVKAHSFVLQLQSKILKDLIQSRSVASGSHISISAPTGVDKEGLVIFLRALYGGGISQTLSPDLKKHVILAAHKYEVHHVRIAAETSLVDDCLMTDASVLDWYHFAKCHTCPLLQEQAAEYFFLRAHPMKTSDNWSLLFQTTETFLDLIAKASEKMTRARDSLSVDELRTEIAELGGDVDGDEAILRQTLEKLKAPRKRARSASFT